MLPCAHSLYIVCKVYFALLGRTRSVVRKSGEAVGFNPVAGSAVGMPFLTASIQPVCLLFLDVLTGPADALLILDIGDGLVEDLRQLAQNLHTVPFSLGGPDVVHQLAVDLLKLLNSATRRPLGKILLKGPNLLLVHNGQL